MTSTAWNTWPDSKWLSNPAKPPECEDWSDGEWERRVGFMVRKIRGHGAGEARAARRGTPIQAGTITAATVPTSVRAEIVATASRRAREQEAANADLRRRLLAEADAQDAEKTAAKAQADADRALQMRGGLPAIITPPTPQLRSSTVKIGDEPAVYGPGSDWSYFRDRFLAATHGMGAALPTRRVGDTIHDVRKRLARHASQMQHLARRGSDSERALIRGYFTERYRPYHTTVSDHSADDFRTLLFGEARADTTTSMAFTPPVFVLEQFQLYRTAASAIAAACGQRPLPKTGMQVTIPRFSSKVNMAVQATQNTAVASSTPTTTFVEAPVLTLAGKVPVSQQYLDRVGPGVTGDEVIAQAAAREAGTVLDQQVIAAVSADLPTANKLTNSGTPSTSALFADAGKGTSLLTTTEGTRLPPSHLFLPGANLAWYLAQTDTSKRPIFLPSPAGVGGRNADVDGATEGYVGYDVAGARLTADENLGITPHAELLLGNFPRGALVFTAPPIVDIWPEWEPANLTCLITIRQYAAISVLYPAAFVKITGAAYPKAPTFTGS